MSPLEVLIGITIFALLIAGGSTFGFYYIVWFFFVDFYATGWITWIFPRVNPYAIGALLSFVIPWSIFAVHSLVKQQLRSV